jgi:predicted RNA-binding Zn ribbon-like protein
LRERALLTDDEEVDADGFVVARSLRAALRELALLNTLRRRPDETERARLDAALAPLTLRAEVDDAGRLAAVPGGACAGRALATLVAIVLEAQASGEWSRLKACRKDTCGWLFYDGSRNRSSSWCSMSICGNRAKTSAYRRRRGAAG